MTRLRLWLIWKLLPSGYSVGTRTYGGVIKEVRWRA